MSAVKPSLADNLALRMGAPYPAGLPHTVQTIKLSRIIVNIPAQNCTLAA